MGTCGKRETSEISLCAPANDFSKVARTTSERTSVLKDSVFRELVRVGIYICSFQIRPDHYGERVLVDLFR